MEDYFLFAATFFGAIFFTGVALVVLVAFWALALDGGWLIGTIPIFLAGVEISLDLWAPLQLGSAMELKASRSFSPQAWWIIAK